MLGESAAQGVAEALAEHEIATVSAISRAEARAALARARRGRRLTPQGERVAWERFERVWDTAAVLEVDHALLGAATELAGRHRLRGYDAVQLASALRAADLTGGRAFVCLDGELNAAASAEDLACLP